MGVQFGARRLDKPRPLPETDDMDCPTDAQRPDSVEDLEALLSGTPRLAPLPAGERGLRCVSSGYMSDGCSCEAAVPAQAVVAAWERERRERHGDRFFAFTWNDQVWLGYGLRNGRVPGGYCPEHRAERDEP